MESAPSESSLDLKDKPRAEVDAEQDTIAHEQSYFEPSTLSTSSHRQEESIPGQINDKADSEFNVDQDSGTSNEVEPGKNPSDLDLNVGDSKDDGAPDMTLTEHHSSAGETSKQEVHNQSKGPYGLPMVHVTENDKILEILTSRPHATKMLFLVKLNNPSNIPCWIDISLMEHQADSLHEYWKLTGNSDLPSWAKEGYSNIKG